MPVTQEGEFFFEDRALYGGIRQDLPNANRHFAVIKNFHLRRKGVLTKRQGTKEINVSAMSGTPDIYAGKDCHFADGTQKLVMATASEGWVYNASTEVFDAGSLTLTDGDTSMLFFADQLLLANGTEFKDYDGSSWGDVSGSPPLGTLLAPHANRAIVSGRAAAPYEFYYSGVRNSDSWDVSNDKVIVGGTSGEVLTGMGTLGRWLVVGSQFNTWVYLQSASNPGDWDFINLSETVGPCAHKSMFECVARGMRMTLFWTPDGPVVIYQRGDEVGMKPLWNPIYKMVGGVTEAPLDGINTARFSQISGDYNPELSQACFGVPKEGQVENNMVLAYDVDGLVAYIEGQIDEPIVTVNDNGNSGVYPCDNLMQVRVDENTGLPSTTGKNRFYGGRDGDLWRHEQPSKYKDADDVPVSFWVIRDGFNGEEEGVGGFEKVATRGRVEGTQNGGFAVTLTVSADSGSEAQTKTLSLDGDLGLWGDGANWSTNPSVSKWNQATIKKVRGDYGVHGANFRLQATDYGAINNKFEMSELSVDGQIYERQ